MVLADFNEKVDRLIQDDSGRLERGEIDAFILEALSYYSKDAPYVKVADIAGDGSYEYALPADWSESFSLIKSVEYPAGKQVPVCLDASDFGVYKTESNLKLRFYTITPQSGDIIRLTYITLYARGTIDSVPAQDTDALCNLAAGLCCGALSRIYSQTSDPAIDADSVNYQGKANEYAKRAEELIIRYSEHMGKKDGSPLAACGVRDWDTFFSWGGDYLIHPQTNR